MKTILSLILAFLLCLPAQASGFAFTYTFVAHTPLLSTQLNTNFGQAATAFTSGGNGHLRIGNSSLTYTDALPTSTGSSITITGGSGTLNFEVADALMKHVTVPLTSANILGMYAAPVQLIAAPAAGKNLVIHKVLFTMVSTATQYANGGVVEFQLGNTVHGAGTATTATIAAAVVNAAAGTSYNTVIPVSYVGSAATGLFISNQTAAFDTGTGTALVDIWYSVQ